MNAGYDITEALRVVRAGDGWAVLRASESDFEIWDAFPPSAAATRAPVLALY
jgi:hypothetical protein